MAAWRIATMTVITITVTHHGNSRTDASMHASIITMFNGKNVDAPWSPITLAFPKNVKPIIAL